MRAALSSMIAAFWILASPYTYGQTPEDTIWVGNIELVLGMQEDGLVRKFAEQYRLQKMGEGKTGFNSWILTSKTGPPYRLYANVSFEEGRLTFRGLDGDMEVLDYSGNRHEIYGLTRATSRWDQYNHSFDKAVGAYLQSVRAENAPPVPGISGLRELQFEAALKRSIRLLRPVNLQDELPLD